jgi:3-oxoacyl-[acyl-carrier-protein] synthase II
MIMNLKRVVITGLGALTPIGNDLNTFWDNLVAGKSGAGPITLFDAARFKTQFACEVKGFDIHDFFDRKEARKMDRYCQFAQVAADQAIHHAGLDLEGIDKTRVGVIWASGIGGIKVFQDEITDFARGDGTPRFNPFFIPKMIADMGAGLISIRHGFNGVNFATVSACASSTHALIDAFNYIRLGKANVIVTGGSESAVTEGGIGGFNAMKALSENNENALTASRPWDRDRDGFVLGEGAGAIILEELEHAKARGATIYGEMVGSGATADAYHMTATHPEGLGAVLGMKMALEEAGLSPGDVDYINAHATSTPVGDPSEIKAIDQIFGEYKDRLHVSGTKSMTGHLLGAAGAVEGIASVLSIYHGIVPPTINLDNPDESLPQGINLTPNHAVKKTVKVAMSNTFGFGGHNAIALFKAYEG